MAMTGAFMLALVAPQLLASMGLMGPGSIQGWSTLLGMTLALPILLTAGGTVILTVVGLARGPRALRMRIGIWWVVGLGGGTLSAVTAPKVGFNPYLGTPPPPFGPSEALTLFTLGLLIVLPCLWIRRARAERDPGDGSPGPGAEA